MQTDALCPPCLAQLPAPPAGTAGNGGTGPQCGAPGAPAPAEPPWWVSAQTAAGPSAPGPAPPPTAEAPWWAAPPAATPSGALAGPTLAAVPARSRRAVLACALGAVLLGVSAALGLRGLASFGDDPAEV